MLTLGTDVITAAIADGVMMISLYDAYYNEINPSTGVKTPTCMYMTDAAESVSFESRIYKDTPIKRSNISTGTDGKIEPVTISIGNIDEDRTIQQIIESHDIIGQKIILREMLINTATMGIIGGTIAEFTVKGAKARLGQVDFTAGVGFDFLINTIPGRKMFSKACRWPKFGDEYCKKVLGVGETCNRTYEDCTAKGNQINFGGAPAILNQRIYF
jgi:phage-related protein